MARERLRMADVNKEKMMKTSALYCFRTAAVMVAMPMVFIVIYPLVYLMLPESTARLADLPQDLMIFLLIEFLVIPAAGVWMYSRAKHRASAAGERDARDTRDVL